MPSTQAQGQAAGSAGTVAPGPIVTMTVSGPGYLSEVTATLREGADTGGLSPLGGGAVLVEMQLSRGSGASASGWALPARWRRASYVGTSIGPLYHPDIYLAADEVLTLAVRVWNRDNIRGFRTLVDLEAHVTPAPAGSADWDPFPYGSFAAGTGHSRTVSGSDAAAGSEAGIAVTVGLVWRLIQAQVTLVTDATASSRITQWQILNYSGGTPDPYIGVSTGAQAASQTKILTCGVGMGLADISGADKSYPMVAGAVLRQLAQISTVTANLQAGDNYGPMIAIVEEWVVPEVTAV